MIFLRANGSLNLTSGKKLATFEDNDTGIRFARNNITIPVKDEQGNEIANIIASTEDMVGTGTQARAKIKKVQLKTREINADFTPTDSAVGNVSVAIDVDLSEVPVGASIKIKPTQNVSKAMRYGFNLTAEKYNLTIDDIAYSVDVNK